jgi:hypothetical protein
LTKRKPKSLRNDPKAALQIGDAPGWLSFERWPNLQVNPHPARHDPVRNITKKKKTDEKTQTNKKNTSDSDILTTEMFAAIMSQNHGGSRSGKKKRKKRKKTPTN